MLKQFAFVSQHQWPKQEVPLKSVTILQNRTGLEIQMLLKSFKAHILLLGEHLSVPVPLTGTPMAVLYQHYFSSGLTHIFPTFNFPVSQRVGMS